MIYIVGPYHQAPKDANVINTTSHSKTWSTGLSPFYCGPVDLYDGYVSKNVENAWQYSKVYEYYAEDNKEPGERYFKWAKDGWDSVRAVRYPMGKGAKPMYSYWNGKKLGYIDARKEIYIPLYAQAVQKTFAFQKLKKMVEEPGDLYLWDFDGYNHRDLGLSFEQVINDPVRTMGHAFVIAMLLEGYL